MTQIEILLNEKFNRLSTKQKNIIINIAKEEFIRMFGINLSELKVNIANDFFQNKDNDIILVINADNIKFTDKSLSNYKDMFKTILSLESEIKNAGYKGNVGYYNGKMEDITNNKQNAENKKKENFTEKKDSFFYSEATHLRAQQYVAVQPRFKYEQVALPESVKKQIEYGLARIELSKEAFEKMGLYSIASPICALSLYGGPGTGKSMVAEGIASRETKSIIRASYADIENMYVGEGPKNINAIFYAAEAQDAVLFIDESDSLLSKRLVNSDSPQGQSINSMRSQMLIALEKFRGIVIFATNLAKNYDKAVNSRLININVSFPDAETREKIWRRHLISDIENNGYKLNIPLEDNIDFKALAEKYFLTGRDIRNAVVDACIAVIKNKTEIVTYKDLCDSAEAVIKRNEEVARENDELSAAQKQIIANKMQKDLDKQKEEKQQKKEEIKKIISELNEDDDISASEQTDYIKKLYMEIKEQKQKEKDENMKKLIEEVLSEDKTENTFVNEVSADSLRNDKEN